MRLTNPLAVVRGQGSAKDGTRHWWAQRLTAVALVPLTFWFILTLVKVIGADYATAMLVLGHPLTAAVWILFVGVLFYHCVLGLQVVIEDYLHDERAKIAAIILMKMVLTLLGTVCILSVVRAFVGP